MQIHSLSLESFYEEDYILIGIHTSLEDYKLAFLINNSLKIHLQKIKNGLALKDKQTKATFSLFKYSNEKEECEWSLISNSSKEESENIHSDLQLKSEVKSYLIPEQKRVDYFLKICGEQTEEFAVIIKNKIKEIEQVITSYTIKKDSLKSRDFLTF